MACVNKLLTALLAVLVLPFHFSRFMIPGLFYREEAVAAFKKGETQLAGLKRQVVLGQMYPSSRSVMEVS
jgi:hypothetical protein